MSEQANTIPVRLAKQLAGRCVYPGCEHEATDGDHCDGHGAKVREWRRAGAKAARDRLREDGVCLVCRRPSKRTRCADCRNKHRLAERDRRRKARGVDRESRGVDQSQPRTKLEVHADGYTRVRTTGRGHRGAVSRAEQMADAERMLKANLKRLASALSRLPLWEEVDQLARFQRDEGRAQQAEPIAMVIRELADVAATVAPATWKALCPCCGGERERE